VKKIVILALALLLSGCSEASNSSSYTISQDSVRSISLKNQATFSVSRVVVLANGVAEIMQSLNAQSILVGRDISSTEKSLESIPVVTSGHQVIPERVLALNPDLVIIDASTGPSSAINQIRSTGVKIVMTPESWNLSDISVKIRAVGAAIGANNQADALIEKMQQVLSVTSVANKPRVAFLYLRGTSAIYLIGGPGSGADSLLLAVGAEDVGAQKLDRPFNALTAESLAALNPDVILVMTKGLASVGGVEGLIKLPGVAQTTAGKNSAIIDVDDSLLLSFGPRTPSLLAELAKAFAQVAP
jgi:iron complex transport system substrate-binding protein